MKKLLIIILLLLSFNAFGQSHLSGTAHMGDTALFNNFRSIIITKDTTIYQVGLELKNSLEVGFDTVSVVGGNLSSWRFQTAQDDITTYFNLVIYILTDTSIVKEYWFITPIIHLNRYSELDINLLGILTEEDEIINDYDTLFIMLSTVDGEIENFTNILGNIKCNNLLRYEDFNYRIYENKYYLNDYKNKDVYIGFRLKSKYTVLAINKISIRTTD
jgi:hypothetical protein